MSEIERPQRARLSFPYWLALILFLVTLGSAIALGGQFVLSPDYRADRLLYGGITVGVAFVLWLWILGSTRRFRKRDFAGPIQTVRGADSPFQVITSLLLLSVATWLGYTVTIPMAAHALSDQRTVSYDFALTGTPAAPRGGCARVSASQDFYGETTICVPPDLVPAGATTPPALRLTGRRSDFGFWPERFEVANARGPVRKVVPDKDAAI
jgi:hypothetical protein